MRQDVKELADAMEKGWKQLPKMSRWYFESANGAFTTFSYSVNRIHAACAQGHALIGVDVLDANRRKSLFPVLGTQEVVAPFYSRRITLEDAINSLVMDYKWSTPRIVKWLRTHQKD